MTSTADKEAPTMISEPTSSKDLAATLAARRRKRLPALTLALVVLIAAAVAFIGGIEAHKRWGTSTTATGSGRPAGAAAFSGLTPPAGFTPGGSTTGGANSGAGTAGGLSGFGGVTSGTVTLIKGSTLYVTSTSGNTVLVHTSARSRVTKTVAGSIKTIHPGDSVTVIGTRNANGSYSARQLTVGGTNG